MDLLGAMNLVQVHDCQSYINWFSTDTVSAFIFAVGPRNYAFVEFYDTDSAVRWMESNAVSYYLLGSEIHVPSSVQRTVTVLWCFD